MRNQSAKSLETLWPDTVGRTGAAPYSQSKSRSGATTEAKFHDGGHHYEARPQRAMVPTARLCIIRLVPDGAPEDALDITSETTPRPQLDRAGIFLRRFQGLDVPGRAVREALGGRCHSHGRA